ncbi:hypothetical protein [Methylocystis echinoides]|uniref:Uncharacterized protein n=1 Tax=Methylocystis echinoides TaxID=29468 RepID=A0A9W6LRX8_9HYPH|nr:hypothetical protein [Methylocystis echinoides]GLI92993.1 hypothetical protein LMG27198_19850 [Methylocystis echinoides]
MLDESQIAIAVACIMDSVTSALDPSGAALRRACSSLRDGISVAEQMDAADTPAASLLKQIVANIEEVNKA